MKKLLLLLSFLASVASASAQEGSSLLHSSADYGPSTTDSRNNGFGIKGGYNLANVYGADKGTLADRSNLNAFVAGIYAQFSLNNKFSIQPEFLYSRKGYRFPKGTSPKHTVRLDYLQVPVLLVYNIVDNVSIHLGPEVSLLTKIKTDSQEMNISSSGFHSLDYGVVGGAEARIGPARVGARYDLSLAKLGTAPAFSTGNKIYNQAFQVYVGIGFSG